MEQTLDQAFFDVTLRHLKEEFAQQTGATKISLDLLLRTGQHMRLEGEPTCAGTYITFDRKDGARATRVVLPYSSIVAVTLVEESERRMGF